MQKTLALALAVLLFFAPRSTFAEYYKISSCSELKELAEEVISKRDPKKTIFIMPLMGFVVDFNHPAIKSPPENYSNLLAKAFGKFKKDSSALQYSNELLITELPFVLIDNDLPDLISYLQSNQVGVIFATPNMPGKINKIESLEVWIVQKLKEYNIDLDNGIYKQVKFTLNELTKVKGYYPSFHAGLLSYNQNSGHNSLMQALSVLLTVKFTEMPNVVVEVAFEEGELEAMERQINRLSPKTEFYGILYTPPAANIPQKQLSPAEYLSFWQDFATKLVNIVTIKNQSDSNNPYAQ